MAKVQFLTDRLTDSLFVSLSVLADLPRKYRGSIVNIVGLGSASLHHDQN